MFNWKTTLAGIATGLIPIADAIQNAVTAGQLKMSNGFEAILGIGIMVLGYLAADAPAKSAGVSTAISSAKP